MKVKSWMMLAAMGLASNSFGASIAIIDSGVDYQHEALQGKIWTNPVDSTENRRDEDGNGYKDDIYGWNFFGNNNRIIDYKHNDLFDADVERFFKVQGDMLNGAASQEDIDWLRGKVADREFTGKLNKFGAYVHGTHVAAIAAEGNDNAEILTVRLIPVENPLQEIRKGISKALDEGKPLNDILKNVIKVGLGFLAKQQSLPFQNIGKYVHGHKMQVANASIGMGMMQAKMIVAPLVRFAMRGKEPNPAVVEELAIHFVNEAVKGQGQITSVSPDTLFVFAAGNDGTNNDLLPTSPANVKAANAITVGAALSRSKIAPFSNYGDMVDVLAPGVAILSAIPNDLYLQLSGTSQAAPYVAGIAAKIIDANAELSPSDVRKIIMGTVDEKAEFKGLVKSSGIVNSERALFAAEQAKSMGVLDAIAQARISVKDIQEDAFTLSSNSQWFPMPGIQ